MESRRRRPENPCKRYVKVRADFGLDGSIRPLLFRGEDGPVFRIDRILDVRQAASLKAGGQGIRYVCEAEGSIAVLFHDEPYWLSSGKRTPDARQRWRCSLPLGNAGFA